jgi:hypothetical protein
VQQITSDMKVAEVIRRCPETADVFSRRGCHTIRGLMARIMTVRNVARMEGIDLMAFVEELNSAHRAVTATDADSKP